jgi:hypothetical protein
MSKQRCCGGGFGNNTTGFPGSRLLTHLTSDSSAADVESRKYYANRATHHVALVDSHSFQCHQTLQHVALLRSDIDCDALPTEIAMNSL